SSQQALTNALTHHPIIAITNTKIEQDRDGIDLMKKINQSFFLPVIYFSEDYNRDILYQAQNTPIAAYLLRSPDNEKSKNELITSILLALHNLQSQR
ncbi:MAG: hypothetical protein AAFU64_16990, partial [Bacteroidota bacterium]